ncbi:hypothetical protein thsps117_34360 [Pseudomonas sp. No.117]
MGGSATNYGLPPAGSGSVTSRLSGRAGWPPNLDRLAGEVSGIRLLIAEFLSNPRWRYRA